MSIIKSYAAKEAGADLSLWEYDAGELQPEDVEVEVEYCGICHSDLSMIDNEWGMSSYPLVAGHEVIGRVAALGSAAQDKGLKIGQKVGIGWTFFILMFAVLVSVVAHLFLGDGQESSTIFIAIVRRIFTGPWLGLISGLLLSAILAGAMSTADSQLLAASSAFASDVYKPVIRKGQSTDKEMLWVGRIVVLVIAAAALLIASNPGSGTIMSLVENAWGIFGASFGPVIVLSLFWRGFTFSGAAAGIVAGAVVDVLWLVLFKSTGVYEIVPGFAAGLLAAVIASKCSSAESRETAAALFDQCIAYKD